MTEQRHPMFVAVALGSRREIDPCACLQFYGTKGGHRAYVELDKVEAVKLALKLINDLGSHREVVESGLLKGPMYQADPSPMAPATKRYTAALELLRRARDLLKGTYGARKLVRQSITSTEHAIKRAESRERHKARQNA